MTCKGCAVDGTAPATSRGHPLDVQRRGRGRPVAPRQPARPCPSIPSRLVEPVYGWSILQLIQVNFMAQQVQKRHSLKHLLS